MSRKLVRDNIDPDTLNSIHRKLQIKKENNKYSFGSAPTYIYPIDEESDRNNVYVPFAFDRKIPRPPRERFRTVTCHFEGKLRDNQKKVQSEAIAHLNKYGSTIIAAFPGFGKCLRKNTPVVMYDGTIKMVQDIIGNDVLMGDDSTPRNVISTCVGEETMYEIVPEFGDPFGCNETHILSLVTDEDLDLDNIEIKQIEKVGNYRKIDISLKDYLHLSFELRSKLKLYRESIEFPDRKVKDPYTKGYDLFDDNIPHKYKCNSRTNRLELLAGLIDRTGYAHKDKCLLLKISKRNVKDILYVIRSLGMCPGIRLTEKGYTIYFYGDIDKIPLRRYDQSSLISTVSTYRFQIRHIPDTTYYGFCIDGNHRFLLGDFTVTHNTCTAINIASKIRIPTLILAHRVVLINQWKESIEKFCPSASVQILESSSVMKNCDFYIMNPSNIHKHNRSFYSGIGFLIVDESHLIMAEKMSESMLYFCPRYVLGLSATPYRMDGLNKLLDLYFGKHKIERKLWHRHTVFTVDSGFTPEMEETKTGKVNWNTVLNSQAMDPKRNEMIVELVKFFRNRIFLILCKRVAQAKHLVTRLTEEGENVTSLIGTQQHYGHDSRILVGTTSKCGVGFDHPRLNSLILASDIEQYFVQFLGRIFRTQKVEPLIFDIIDNNPILKKHARTRRTVYIEHGGTVKNFNRSYPEFMKQIKKC